MLLRMSRGHPLLLVSIVILILSCAGAFSPIGKFSVVVGQEVATNPTTPERPASVTEQKAYDLLDSLAERITTLRAPENRVYMECAVADLLWSRDEKRAREIFEIVTKDVASLVAEIDTGDPQAYNTVSVVYQLRQEVMNRLAQHDPEMALTFLRATRLQSSDQRDNAGSRAEGLTVVVGGSAFGPNERNLELQLAGMIAVNDPQRALRMARARLAHGLSYPLVALLSQINLKDPAAARDLHKEMVARLKEENLERNQESFNAAWNLTTVFQPPQADEETYRQLIEILAGSALSVVPGSAHNSFAQNVYHQVQSYLPQITRYAPEHTAALEQWTQSVERTLDPGARMYVELNRINLRGGTVDDIIALAQKYPAELQPQLYREAAWKAISEGNADRARQIVAEQISDPMQRGEILAQIENQLLWNDVGGNKLAEARARLRKVRDTNQRVQILIQFARNLAGNGDQQGTLDLLNEARALVASSPQTSSKLEAQMLLARGYASLDSDQSFALMQGVVIQVNQLVAAAAVLDGFENRYLQDGEWLMRGGNGLSNLVNNMGENLGLLASQDLDSARGVAGRRSQDSICLIDSLRPLGSGQNINRAPDNRVPDAPDNGQESAHAPGSTRAFDSACALADQLERPEVRFMAQLAIAQAVLDARIANLPVQGRGFVRISK